MLTTAERLCETALILPEPLLAEVLDFAEFLQSRTANIHVKATDINLVELCGGLEHSEAFSGSPLEIQQLMRDEWR